MSDLLVLGTDTDAGKTTFALLWLAAFGDGYEYWKPVETGESDSERVRQLLPEATIHPPAARYASPVSPPLAASREGREVPSASAIATARPALQNVGRRLLIETFGSPFSPLNQEELQLALIRLLAVPSVLIVSSALGATGRALQGMHALAAYDFRPVAIVLVGPPDEHARTRIVQHFPDLAVTQIEPPGSFDTATLLQSAQRQRSTLQLLRNLLLPPPTTRDGTNTVQVRDRRCVWHPYTPLREPDSPLVCVGTHDEFLELADGRRLIDGISSWWTILHGHRHPPLMQALREASAVIDHVLFAGATHPWAVEFAEILLRSAGLENGRVFYSDNGSTAVEVALKMAYQFWCQHGKPQRTCFVGFRHGYHGDTFGAMAVSRDPVFFGRFEPLLFRAEILPLSADCLDEFLARRGHEVAAVIVEPLVQGAGGMRMHTPSELRDLAAAARRHGVLFIADEAMTGGGRTGTLWAYQAAGVMPDLVCAAKTLAGGVLPLAATLAAPHIVAVWDHDDRRNTFFHGHSFTAHPLACAVALANWRMLAETEQPAASRMEALWRAALEDLRTHALVRDVRVRGIIAALEIDVPGGYLAEAGRTMRRAALEQGVLLRPLGNVLYALPPYCTSEESLERIVAAMRAAVAALDG